MSIQYGLTVMATVTDLTFVIVIVIVTKTQYRAICSKLFVGTFCKDNLLGTGYHHFNVLRHLADVVFLNNKHILN